MPEAQHGSSPDNNMIKMSLYAGWRKRLDKRYVCFHCTSCTPSLIFLICCQYLLIELFLLILYLTEYSSRQMIIVRSVHSSTPVGNSSFRIISSPVTNRAVYSQR